MNIHHSSRPLGAVALSLLLVVACGGALTPPVDRPPAPGDSDAGDADAGFDGGELKPGDGGSEPGDGGLGTDGGTPDRAVFAQWTAQQRAEVVSRAMGRGAASAMAFAHRADRDAAAKSCPTVVFDGRGFAYDAGAGCASADGATYSGAAWVMNPAWVPGYNADATTRVRFVQFERVTAQGALRMDGTLVRMPSPTGHRLAVFLRFGAPDTLEIVEDLTCSNQGMVDDCALEGAYGSAAGRGAFDIEGQMATDGGSAKGWLELRGGDVLRVELSPDATCHPATLDGAPAGEVCLTADSL